MIPPSVRIFLCPEPIDMRYGFDRLVHLCRQRLGQDPIDGGAVFVFVGRTATRLKLLWFERNGLCVLYKRLHRAVFRLPASAPGQRVLTLDSAALAQLLAGVASVRTPKRSTELMSYSPFPPS